MPGRPTTRRIEEPTSVSASAARGRAARRLAPRSGHARFEPTRRTSPLTLLEEQARTRVADLVPIRYGRMVASPFTFFRGAAAVMANDLADEPRTGLVVQLCGDAHLLNFGGFAAPDRHLVFSINDFDETLPGPFEWDVKRLAASCAVAARDLGYSSSESRSIVLASARTYREAMQRFASRGTLDVWYARLDIDEVTRQFGAETGKSDRAIFRKAVSKAETRDRLRAAAKLTEVVDGRLQFRADPPTLVPLDQLAPTGDADHLVTGAGHLLGSYTASLPADRRLLARRFRYTDAARKVVGVGSVGTRTWVLLMVGRDDDDPLLLQVKEAQASVLEPHLGASTYRNHGRRVVEGQRLMQAASDILLGWQRSAGFDGEERDFYVRQLWDMKGTVHLAGMAPTAMSLYTRMCAWTLARAHARSGDAVAIAAYLGRSDVFDRALAAFADACADQNVRDHAELRRAVDDGTVTAVEEV